MLGTELIKKLNARATMNGEAVGKATIELRINRRKYTMETMSPQEKISECGVINSGNGVVYEDEQGCTS